MVVRHAEDEKAPNPPGGPDILSAVGEKHARLYPKLFQKYLAVTHGIGSGGAEVKVCPVGKIIAIDPVSNPENRGPSTNPYKTIEPLATDLKLTIQTKDPKGVHYSTVYDWNTPERLKTLLVNGSPTPTSTVIAWDKQGLNPDETDLTTKKINGNTLNTYPYHSVPLLKALPMDATAIVGSGAYYTPQRTDFYVFALQDAGTGKFASAKAYKQQFSDDGGKIWYDRTALNATDNPNDIQYKSK
jgi:hypothetical protein